MARASVSVVLPCLNEVEGVEPAVREALSGLACAGLHGEVIVVDNGSTDGSADAAERAGARVIYEPVRGMGAAVSRGVREANGDIIVMADADLTYDLANLGELVSAVEAGADMAIGDRFALGLDGTGMPRLHRYVGTPALTAVVRLLSGVTVKDTQSGFRVFRRREFIELGVSTPGWEFNFEMFVRAQRAGWKIVELPSRYRSRVGESKLRTFSAGWSQLRLLLVMSPHAVLFFPGLALLLAGLVLTLMPLLRPQGLTIAGLTWLPIFIGPMGLIIGARMGWLGVLAIHRSPFVPASLRAKTSFLHHPNALDRVLISFSGLLIAGLLIDCLLAILFVLDTRGDGVIALAGLAQAMIVVGADGLASTLAADFAERSLHLRTDYRLS